MSRPPASGPASAASPALNEQKAEVKESDLPKDTPQETEEADRVVSTETPKKVDEEQKEKAGRRIRGQVTVLFTDGENNTGREPLIEIERARANGSRVYMIGVDLKDGAAQDIAVSVPGTGGKYYDVRKAADLDQAMTDINNIEKGVFTAISVRRNQPAYFVFVLLALGCLALRMVIHTFPQFIEVS